MTNIIKKINGKEFVLCYLENGEVKRDYKTGLFNIKRDLEKVKEGMKKEYKFYMILNENDEKEEGWPPPLPLKFLRAWGMTAQPHSL